MRLAASDLHGSLISLGLFVAFVVALLLLGNYFLQRLARSIIAGAPRAQPMAGGSRSCRCRHQSGRESRV